MGGEALLGSANDVINDPGGPRWLPMFMRVRLEHLRQIRVVAVVVDTAEELWGRSSRP